MKQKIPQNLVFSFLASFQVLKFLFPSLHEFESRLVLEIVLRRQELSGPFLLLPLLLSLFLVS